MDETSKAAIFSAIRTILGIVAGVLAARGFINEEAANQILGAVMMVIPIMWGVIDKYLSERKTQARIADAVSQAAPPDAVATSAPRP